jgi:3-hydroxybutyryl-CoA dehydrogenase
MTICVLADEPLKNELLQKGFPDNVEIVWADTAKVFYSVSDVDVYFDLLFNADRERLARLQRLRGKPVFINAVTETLAETEPSFIRVNGWPTMLGRAITELAIYDSSQEEIIAGIFKQLQWEYKIVPDVPGMITPRIIAMIINEAYYTLEQKVSTKEEIDTAMKLGTNYPFGPFEWSRKIGLEKIHSLLDKLSVAEERYQPCGLLKAEV